MRENLLHLVWWLQKHPETNVRNLGVYRIQIIDSTHALMHWQKHKRGAAHYDISKEKKQED